MAMFVVSGCSTKSWVYESNTNDAAEVTQRLRAMQVRARISALSTTLSLWRRRAVRTRDVQHNDMHTLVDNVRSRSLRSLSMCSVRHECATARRDDLSSPERGVEAQGCVS